MSEDKTLKEASEDMSVHYKQEIVYIPARMHKPKTVQSFWCSCCDGGPVDSSDDKTGKFFTISGAEPSDMSELSSTLFAICTDCLEGKV